MITHFQWLESQSLLPPDDALAVAVAELAVSLLLSALLLSLLSTLQMLRNQLAMEDRPSVAHASSQTPVTWLEKAVTAVLAQKQEVKAVVPRVASTAGGTHPPLAS